jgi:hypothetical protein
VTKKGAPIGNKNAAGGKGKARTRISPYVDTYATSIIKGSAMGGAIGVGGGPLSGLAGAAIGTGITVGLNIRKRSQLAAIKKKPVYTNLLFRRVK